MTIVFHRVVPFFGIGVLLAACTTGGSSVSALDPGFQALTDGNYAEARDVFAPAQAESPRDPYLQLDLGTAYQGMGRMDLAEPLYRQTLVDGKDVVPQVTTNPNDVGKSLAQIACENLTIGLKTNPGC